MIFKSIVFTVVVLGILPLLRAGVIFKTIVFTVVVIGIAGRLDGP